MENQTKQAAMSQADLRSLLRALILAGGASTVAAGVGSILHANKEDREAEKRRNPASDRTAITVNIKKDKFMGELPKPSEIAVARGESTSTEKPVAQLPGSDTSVKALPAPQDVSSLSDKDLASLKKSILRSHEGSPINFFAPKAASCESPKNDPAKAQPKDQAGVKKTGPVATTIKNPSGTPRAEDGRFASTDPSRPSEKVGFDLSHPLDSVGNLIADAMGSAANNSVNKTIIYGGSAAAAIGSAALLSSVVNKIRENRANKDLENSRKDYLKELSGSNEKSAQAGEDVQGSGSLFGGLLGAGLIAPGILTGIIVNKVIENRRKEKKDQKASMNSFPEEPTIFYKTSEDKSCEVSLESILSTIIVKEAAFQAIERFDSWRAMEKSASIWDSGINRFADWYSNMNDTSEADADALEKDPKKLLENVRWLNEMNQMSPEDQQKKLNSLSAAQKAEYAHRIDATKKFYMRKGNTDKTLKYFNDVPEWKKFQDEQMDAFINKKYNAGTPGSTWYNNAFAAIVRWITHTFGLGRDQFANQYQQSMRNFVEDPTTGKGNLYRNSAAAAIRNFGSGPAPRWSPTGIVKRLSNKFGIPLPKDGPLADHQQVASEPQPTAAVPPAQQQVAEVPPVQQPVPAASTVPAAPTAPIPTTPPVFHPMQVPQTNS